MSNLINAAIYIRVSTGKESQETSLEYQELTCRDYANNYGYNIVDVYKDVYTATKTGYYNKRPEYKRLIKDALSKKIDVIIVKDLSRLARNDLELTYIENHMIAKSFHIIAISDGINSITGDTDLFKLFKSYYPEESKAISLRTKQSKKMMAKKGKFIGSIAPYGYNNINGTLVIRDDESPYIVERIFDEYIYGKSAESIAKKLTEENISTPSQLIKKKGASSKWHATTIRKILSNQHYIGNLVQCKTESVNTEYKSRIENSKDNYIIVENTHNSIISKEKFNLVNSIINSKKSNNKVSKKHHLFSNLIYCEQCGKAMSPRNNKYICSGRLKYSKDFCCTENICKDDLIYKLNIDIVNKIDNCEQDFLLKYIQKKVNKMIRQHNQVLINLNTEKNRFENRKKEALDLLLDTEICRDTYHNILNESNNKINEILEEINYTKSLSIVKDKIDLSRDFSLLKSKIIKSVSLKPEILNYFIKRIEISKSGLPKIYYRF